MTTGNDLSIRRLTAADAPACDEIVRSLPYHFGDPDGRRACAEAVRRDTGLVGVRGGRVIGFLTVVHHFEAASEITWMAVHAVHGDPGGWAGPDPAADRPAPRRGPASAAGPDRLLHRGGARRHRRLPAHPRLLPGGRLPSDRKLPDLWAGDNALLLVMPLDTGDGAGP